MKNITKKSLPFFVGIIIFFLSGGALIAGDSTHFEIPGKVSAKIFSNFHSFINTGDNALAFEITRAYFGYESKISENFDACVKLDIGSPEDLSEYSRIRRYAYFKNAYLKFRYENLISYFGIIDLYHFKLQENYWAHRYIEKSFSDRYRFGNTADLGWLVSYECKKWLTADFTIMNGEGYTNLQNDNTLKIGTGITVLLFRNFCTRIYYDYTGKTVNQSTIAAFAGYRKEGKYSASLEYNYRFNDNFEKDHEMFGYSVYTSWNFLKKVQAFGRFDKVSSNKLQNENIPWDLASDGSSVIGGIEYSPVKPVKIAVDYQDWFPSAKNEPNKQFIYINLEISF
jgi:hypothetical protein